MSSPGLIDRWKLAAHRKDIYASG